MAALGQRVAAAPADVYLEQLASLIFCVGFEYQGRVPLGAHVVLPGVRREARLERAGLAALERSLLGMARGTNGLEQLLLPAHRLSEGRGVVPAQITVKDAAAQVAAVALLLQDALPLCVRWAAALGSQQRAEDPLGYARESFASVVEIVSQRQLGQPALDAVGFEGQLPDFANSLGAVFSLRAPVADA